MQGFVEICRIDAKGRRKLMHAGPNTILDAMYPQILQLLGAGGNKYITKMQFGTGIEPADPSQTVMQLPIIPAKATSAVVSPSTFSVEFSAFLEASEANGFTLAEAGLLTYDNILVARTTFVAQPKTSSYQWGIKWTITLKTS